MDDAECEEITEVEITVPVDTGMLVRRRYAAMAVVRMARALERARELVRDAKWDRFGGQ